MEAAFLTDAPRIAGSETWLAETLPRLGPYGIRPTVFLPENPRLEPLAQTLRKREVGVVAYRQAKDLPALTRGYPVRVLQAWYPATYALLQALEGPRAVFLHDQLEYHYPLGLKALFRFLYRITKAERLRRADRVLVGTFWAKDYLERHFRLTSRVVPVGVDPERFRPPSPEERASLRKRLGLSRYTFLTPARFTLEKNQLAVVLAARGVPEAQFLLVGEGGWAEVLRQLAQGMGVTNVRFQGRSKAVAELYRAADAVLFPTLADNPGLVILEGMASGLPVIASGFPPQQEVISPQEGILIQPTPQAIARAARWIMAHPEEARAMGQRGRARVLAERTAEQSASELAQALQELA